MKHTVAQRSSSASGTVERIIHSHATPGTALLNEASAPYGTSDIIDAVKAGLPLQELEALQAFLDIPLEKLAPRLGISRATLHRRKLEGRLGKEESDRVVRLARLMGKAVEVFGSHENARRWLSSPQYGLANTIPLDYAETEVGAREVEDLLGRIQFGVYS
jgi:putative toxin-antitoxin system antitoxin component (TIGR02293 family)